MKADSNQSYANRSSFLTIGDSLVYNKVNGVLTYTGYNSHSVFYTLPNGAKVFSTGTIQYLWGLDDFSSIYSAGTMAGQRIHPIYTNNNAQKLAENTFGCLIKLVFRRLSFFLRLL